MRRFFVLTLFFINGICFSQSGFIGSVGAGLSIPVLDKDFGDNYKAGYNVGLSGGYLFNSTFGGWVNAQYNKFKQKNLPDGYTGDLVFTTISAEIIAGNFKPKAKISPYAYGGFGIYILTANQTNADTSVSNSDTKLGLSAGVGVSFRLSKGVDIFGQAGINYGFSSGYAKGYIPVKIGIMFIR